MGARLAGRPLPEPAAGIAFTRRADPADAPGAAFRRNWLAGSPDPASRSCNAAFQSRSFRRPGTPAARAPVPQQAVRGAGYRDGPDRARPPGENSRPIRLPDHQRATCRPCGRHQRDRQLTASLPAGRSRRHRHPGPLGHHRHQRLMPDGPQKRAAGLVSPTLRSQMPRQARYSRQASRWPEPKTLTNRARPSPVAAWNGRDPLAVASGPVTWLTGPPQDPRGVLADEIEVREHVAEPGS